MMYYRVKSDNFLWKKGAILRGSSDGYRPIEDVWDATPVNDTEYISKRIIEHPDNSKYFERVYLTSDESRYLTAAEYRKQYKVNPNG